MSASISRSLHGPTEVSGAHHAYLGHNWLRGLDLSAHSLWHEEHNSAARGRDVQQLGVHDLRTGAWTYPCLVLARCIAPNECVAFNRGARGRASCWSTCASFAPSGRALWSKQLTCQRRKSQSAEDNASLPHGRGSRGARPQS